MQAAVAIQGEAGSNSHRAVRALLGEQPLRPCTISAEVFERLSVSREVDMAVLPIENSLHGAVSDHYDLLLEYPVEIVAEVSLRIRHALVAAPGVSETEVRRVLSHPVALSQCRRYFLDHPEVTAVPAYDTAGAVRLAIASGERQTAAIAAPEAAEAHGGVVLREGLEDDPENFTRFFLLVRAGERARVTAALADTEVADKMTVAFAIPHRPGSLVAVLNSLAAQGADLSRIESRPVPGRPWEYVFFVDLRLPGAEAAGRMEDVLRQTASMFRLLGRYSAAVDRQ